MILPVFRDHDTVDDIHPALPHNTHSLGSLRSCRIYIINRISSDAGVAVVAAAHVAMLDARIITHAKLRSACCPSTAQPSSSSPTPPLYPAVFGAMTNLKPVQVPTTQP